MSDNDQPDLDQFEYTLTRRALRQLKAEAWDGGYARGFYAATPSPDASENPYRDEAP